MPLKPFSSLLWEAGKLNMVQSMVRQSIMAESTGPREAALPHDKKWKVKAKMRDNTSHKGKPPSAHFFQADSTPLFNIFQEGHHMRYSSRDYSKD